PETRIVGGNQAERAGQPRNQIAEHVRRSRESVQQQDCRRIFGTRVPIKNVEIVYACGIEMHGGLFCWGSANVAHSFLRIVFAISFCSRRSGPFSWAGTADRK